MATARLLTRNVIPASTLTATSFLPLLAPSQLQTYDLGSPFRTADGVKTVAIIVDTGAAMVCNAFALLKSNGIASTTFRVRISTSDPTGAAGEGWDSGVMGSVLDPTYEHMIYYTDVGVSGRYLRIDIVESAANYVELGCLMAGPRWDPSCAFEYGFTSGYQDMDQLVRTRGGVEYVNAGASMRHFEGRFPGLTQAERDTELAYIETVVKRRQPIVFTKDKSSTNLGRDSIVGRLQDMPSFPNVGPNIYQWPVNITELV